MKIRFVPRAEIEKVKYNSCVHYAGNGNIFGYIWYLDFIAKDWDALVEGDYESVMPLPWRRNRLGQKVIVTPPLMRELGIYSIHVLSPKRIRNFLEAIPEEFRGLRLRLNEQTPPPRDQGFRLIERTNQQLLLQQPYETISEGFSRELLLELEQAEQADLLPVGNIKVEEVAEFFKKHGPQDADTEQSFHGLQRVMYNILHRGWGNSTGIRTREGELLAVAFWIYSHKKVTALLLLESPAGKAVRAREQLVNLLLRSHADKPLILDFNTRAETDFAQKFGAKSNDFYEIERGRSWNFWGL